MQHLGTDYRTYALDFWGFGESGKKRESYKVTDFVSLVDQFMENLGIEQAPIIGHSMGGTVSMAVAIKYPHRVKKVGVIGSPVNGNSLSFLLKLFGNDVIAKIVHYNMWALKIGNRIITPLISKDRIWADMFGDSLSQTSLDSFLQSIKSLRYTDLRQDLPKISVPLLGIYGKKDVLVSPNQRKLIETGAQFPQIEYLEGSGHLPMLDEPEKFLAIIKDFLDRQ